MTGSPTDKNRGARGKANPSTGKGEWKPFASFVIEFQARKIKGRAEEKRSTVHYMEADKSETWSGIEAERSLQWMLDQLGEKVQQEPMKETPSKARPAEAPPVTVRITDIQAFQPPETEKSIGVGQAGRPFPGSLRSGESFALEVSFGLAGLAEAAIAEQQVVYTAQFHACNVSAGGITHLGNTEPDTLAAGKISYKAMLPEASLPPGLYRLRTLVRLKGAPAIPGYLEVPMLHVV